MSQIRTLKPRVAVEPFPDAPKAAVKNGVLVPMNASELTPLKVVFTADSLNPEERVIPEGAIAWVRTKVKGTTTYGKEVLEAEGKRFILVPLEEILLLDISPAYSVPSMPVVER